MLEAGDVVRFARRLITADSGALVIGTGLELERG